MKISKEQLFEAFGEILYAVASADGSIQQEEKQLIAQAIRNHRYEFDILLSFKKEVAHTRNIGEAIQKALKTFKAYGPFDGYSDFKVILENLADSCQGISSHEKEILDTFHKELLSNFRIS